ncbi:phosphotransferase family protein [Halogeometricum luteum]|uniref:Phosphotransferase n=1 Tax=Halogeometricum luteum TaxID=2950537 RepID=A0ABU2FWF8_9EURY|nr:phosphotransferase [Halogeometricum sp. S3BR5-2]MDS0292870.1 phosphotransferase [Halogeometricum sp. S3BR5-2]
MDDVTAVLDREFPARTVAETAPARRGNTKETTLVRFADGGGVVVQFSADAEAFRTELAVARAVGARTAVPTPRVLADGVLNGRPYAVVELVDGVDLHERFSRVSSATRRRLSRGFGRSLAALHGSFAFEGYGAVRVEDEGEDGDGSDDGDEEAARDPSDAAVTLRSDGAGSWASWFDAHVRDGISALPAAFDDVRGELLAALDDAHLPRNPTPRLYPWDLRPGNAVFDGEEVVAVLDWGGPLAAAAGLGAAKVEHLVADWYVADGDPLRAAFREGYRSVRPYPEVPPVYRLAAVVRSAVDSHGVVTRPRYPELEGEAAVGFHRERMREWLSVASAADD